MEPLIVAGAGVGPGSPGLALRRLCAAFECLHGCSTAGATQESACLGLEEIARARDILDSLTEATRAAGNTPITDGPSVAIGELHDLAAAVAREALAAVGDTLPSAQESAQEQATTAAATATQAPLQEQAPASESSAQAPASAPAEAPAAVPGVYPPPPTG
jgi:hypothetical protein